MTSYLHSLRQLQAGEGKFSGIIFKAIHRESLFFKKKKKQHISTAAVKNSLNWLNCYKGNYTSGQNLFDLPEISMLCYYQKAEVCDTQADSTLFYCSPLFGIHYTLFSQEIILLCGTILYHRSVYVLWIYNYIYCHYKGTIK